MRAVAIGLVLLYHAGIKVVPGGYIGVDVFFVISGFLITGMLLRELRANGSVSLTQFYARRMRRLLPASSVVLLVTAALVWSIGPETQRHIYGGDIATSALSLVNWRFASRAVDYQAEGIGVSPVQHFWTLSVEEQFYIVWPLLIVLVAVVAALLRYDARRLAISVLVSIAVIPFVWSLSMTSEDSGLFAFRGVGLV